LSFGTIGSRSRGLTGVQWLPAQQWLRLRREGAAQEAENVEDHSFRSHHRPCHFDRFRAWQNSSGRASGLRRRLRLLAQPP